MVRMLESVFDLLEYIVLICVVVQLVRLFLADADLTLLWRKKFGIKPDVLNSRIVWITGASSGIGEYLAYELAHHGCRLVLSARRVDSLEQVKKQCLLNGRLTDKDVLIVAVDLKKSEEHKKAVDTVLKHFGQIDILINNAGQSQRAMIKDTAMEVDRALWEINVYGTLSLTKAVLPHMLARKSGHICVVSSLAGKMGAPFSASYSSTKHALQGWFDTLRAEVVEDKIAVTVVCPGPVFSEIEQKATTGTPGQLYGHTTAPTENKMKTERCAELIAVALANRLDEVWISQHPELFFVYASQYMPAIFKWAAKKVGVKKLKEMRHIKD